MPVNPFIPIIKPYFDYLAGIVQNFANESVKHGVEPDEIIRDFLSEEDRREEFVAHILPEISGYSVNFWQLNLSAVLKELSQIPGMRARFGGDIGPQSRGKLYQRLGIYFDSIIVPDPILRSVTAPTKKSAYYILKFATNLTLYRDAYLSDVYPPIAVLVGEEHLISASPDAHYKELSRISELDSLLLANQLFGRDFNSYAEAVSFVQKFDSDASLLSAIADKSLFFMDDTVGRSPEEQLAESDRETRKQFDEGDTPSGFLGPQRLLNLIHGRMMQVNDVLLGSTETFAHPVIQAPVTFHWLESKLKANSIIMSEVMEQNLLVQLPLTNGLLAEKLKWLANIPVVDLVRFREQGFLGDLRETIGKNLQDLSSADLANLQTLTSEVDYRLNTVLNNHQENLQSIHNEALDGLLAATPSLLVGMAGMVLPLFGLVVPGILLAVAALGKYTLKDVVPNIMKLKRERRILEKSSIGILWAAREKDT